MKMAETYRRTGHIVSIIGLRDLKPGAVYQVHSTEDELRFEELETEMVLPALGPMWVGPYLMDPGARCVTGETGEVKLTKSEWLVMDTLMRRAGQVVPLNLILRETWPGEDWADPQALRVVVSRIRGKLPGIPLLTFKGFGYQLVVSEAGS